ncbi:MAG TPA: hypothetical protein VJ624_06085 [Thermodesulfobacteriota bacterium]|nr:hypothetical protein [Thermodesulfobacteriota bacterium]
MKSKELRIRFVETGTEGISMKAELKPGAASYDIFFRSNDISLTKNSEALLSVGLLPAMKTGSTLIVDGPISQKLFNALDPICDFYCALNPSLRKVKIKNLVPRPAEPPKENRVGTFFSAGVDSFYTLLKHQEEITDLIFIHGFDIPLNNQVLLKKTSEIIQEIGLRFGKRVIELETNLRSFIHPYLRWLHSHGIGFASVGSLLFPFFHRIYVPATHTYANAAFYLLGSHPALDPLWSTETLEFVHDGCEATRVEKVALIAEHEVALKFLRVCGTNTNGAYNCGWCEKCIRTKISLHIAGSLDRCATFDNQLDPKHIEKMALKEMGPRIFAEENLKALKGRPGDRDLYDALGKVFKQSWWLKVANKYPRLCHVRWVYRTLRSLARVFN